MKSNKKFNRVSVPTLSLNINVFFFRYSVLSSTPLRCGCDAGPTVTWRPVIAEKLRIF